MIHAMAETYGVLPSEFLDRADTFDMMVFDVAHTVREHNNADPKKKTELYDQKDLESYFKKIRG